MRDYYDVIVVGAGPAGSMAARYAAQGGVKVLLLEKDRDIGSPVRCAEGVGAVGLKEVVQPQERWIQNRIEGVRLVAPNGKVVQVQSDDFGYILNRKIFDNYLAEEAARAGAEIRTKAYVYGLILEDGFIRGVKVHHLGRDYRLKSRVVIGADGVESRVGRWAGLKTHTSMHDMETCVQMTLANIDVDRRYCYFYFSREIAPGGYLWVFPKGDSAANVGVGISGDYSRYKSPLHYLQRFISKRFPSAAVLTMVAGGVPCSSTLREIVSNGLMLVGDAAHQANPLSGGGIVTAMIAGRIAGRVAAEAIKEGDVSARRLRAYVREWNKAEGRNLRRFYRIKEGVFKLSDEALNRTADVLLKLPPEKRTIINILKTALINQPRLILEALSIFE